MKKARASGALGGEESSRRDTISNVSGFYSRNTGGVKRSKIKTKNKKAESLAKAN